MASGASPRMRCRSAWLAAVPAAAASWWTVVRGGSRYGATAMSPMLTRASRVHYSDGHEETVGTDATTAIAQTSGQRGKVVDAGVEHDEKVVAESVVLRERQ